MTIAQSNKPMPVHAPPPAGIKRSTYITCTGYKGRPRKPIPVCYQCRRGPKCRAFQTYLQPELPFRFKR